MLRRRRWRRYATHNALPITHKPVTRCCQTPFPLSSNSSSTCSNAAAFAAARRHGLTPSAVARRVDALEAALGCQLFSRSTHAVRAMPAAPSPSAPGASFRNCTWPVPRRHPGQCTGRPHPHRCPGAVRAATSGAGSRRVSAGLSRCGYPVAADRQLRRSAWRAPRRGRSGAAHRPTRRYAPGRHAPGADGAHRLRQPGLPGASRRAADPEHCLNMMASTGMRWPRRTPGASNETADRSCCARGVCGWWPTMLKRCWRSAGRARHRPPPTWLISEYLLRGELLPLFCEGGLPQPEASGIYALRLTREADSRTRLLLEFLKSASARSRRGTRRSTAV